MVTEHLDMLQADRLRAWAMNIRRYGANITEWGSPSFVADEAERIAAGIEAAIKESPLTQPAPEDD
jgi:hypothetical protein